MSRFSFIRTPGYSNQFSNPLGGSNNRESTICLRIINYVLEKNIIPTWLQLYMGSICTRIKLKIIKVKSINLNLIVPYNSLVPYNYSIIRILKNLRCAPDHALTSPIICTNTTLPTRCDKLKEHASRDAELLTNVCLGI